MNKKVIYKRHCMWYDKRHPWNLFDDLAVYIKYSLRFYIQWLEKYCDDEELLHEVLTKFSKAIGCQDKSKNDLLCALKKMYFSFDQVSMGYPDSPWNIWWNKNCGADHAIQNFRKENGHVTYKVACEVPDSVKEAQEEYNSAIDEGIKLYANLVEFISGTNVNNGYCVTKKARNHLMKRIDPVLNKTYAFGDDQAWYIYEGLTAFKNAKRYGTPCDLSEDDWNKYLDDMIFAFHEVVLQNEKLDEYEHNVEEYWQKYNNGKKLFGEYFLDLWD